MTETIQLTESFWRADTTWPIQNITVGDLLRRAAAEAPDKLALVSVAPGRDPREWTFAELLDDAERAAAWLLERFEPGEHITVWAPNVPEWIVLQYGAALAGLVLVTANPALRGEELAHVLTASRSVGLFYVGNFRGTDMAALAGEVLPDLPEVRRVVSLESWLDEQVRTTDPRSDLPMVAPDAPTQIQFTSGTTGRPKAALLRHFAMVTNAAFVRDKCGAPRGATYATALPMFHTAGCGLAVMGSLHQTATSVIAEVFDPVTILQAIQDYRVVAYGGVPLMLHAVLAHPDREHFDLSSVQIVMSGGDAVPPALVDGWAQVCGARASAVYGQTELSPVICQTLPGDARQDNLFTAGRPLPQVDVAIRDPHTGEVQPTGVEGEICARGYQVMIGYLDLPEETARTIDADGWLHTGDLGTMNERGYVTVTGRLKDMIIRGGENIYPREVEEALATHDAVSSAVVIGLKDEVWGENVAAVIQLTEGAVRPSAEQLSDYLRGRLAPHKTPKSWYVAAELPTNAMGKLQKFRLRDQISAGELSSL